MGWGYRKQDNASWGLLPWIHLHLHLGTLAGVRALGGGALGSRMTSLISLPPKSHTLSWCPFQTEQNSGPKLIRDFAQLSRQIPTLG